MQRFVLPYIWPIITGILLAVLFLAVFPDSIPFESSSFTPDETADTALITSSETESENQRPKPDIQQAPPLARNEGPSSYADAVNRAAPAVVNIYSSRIVERDQHPLMSDPFFQQFFDSDDGTQQQRMLSSLGSGVIVSENGYVLTNHHVINGADEIQVALRDGRETLAKVIGTDPESDLAVLHIPLDNPPVIALTDSTDVAIGDVSLAIGNPFGVGQTVTMGIISATGRSHLGLNAYENFIQTDAAINPGNSGGALVNTDGALVGINTAIFSRSGGSQGIGFAIPANLAHSILNELVTQGRVIRGWLGIEAQALSRELAASFGLRTPQGVIIAGIIQNGPADLAGLQPGDVLLAVDDQPVLDARATMSEIAAIEPGTTLPLTIVRGGEIMEFTLEVGERPVPAPPKPRRLPDTP
ncbi:Do family serine endopeptidase [Halomonas llamarensis]|uniref:Do family serine endopeptidase n=1 Tax=Halomonas llamarensis TaxID=2945104 RepID=A0ABT0SMN6_9GAMM|nr:Do family serine endopeptidase [Halomonas llamarensis]MCL7928896.1 Do family serine endopeptidase [Halomonas llamarensis]